MMIGTGGTRHHRRRRRRRRRHPSTGDVFVLLFFDGISFPVEEGFSPEFGDAVEQDRFVRGRRMSTIET